jgi:hypothetical protein
VSGSCIAMNPYAPAPDVVIASPPQIGQDQGQEPFDVSQHAGCWIWTSENAPLLGTSVNKGKKAPADAKLTPLLTPPSAQHAATASDREQGNRLRRAVSAAVCNLGQQASVDCGSREGRGFESRRSPSYLQDKHEGRGEEGSLVARPAHKLKVTVTPAPCLRLPRAAET